MAAKRKRGARGAPRSGPTPVVSSQGLSVEAGREREEQLRLVLAATNQGLYDVDLQTGVATVTPEYAGMIGLEPRETRITLDWWRDRIHPADRGLVERTIGECIRGERLDYRIEYRLRCEDGSWKPLLSLGKVVQKDAQGRPLRMLGSHTDMTERVRSENALEDASLLLEAILDQCPVPMVVAGAKELRLLHANQAAVKILGVTDEPSYLGLTFADAMARKSWVDLRPDGSPIDPMDLPIARSLRGEHIRDEEICVRRKDGTRRWESVNGGPVYSGEGDLVAGVIAFPDITERKEADARAAESRERLSLALRGADLGSWDWNIRTGEATFDDRWAGMLGYGVQEIEPNLRSWERLIHPEDLERVRAALDAHIGDRTEHYECEYRLRHRSGDWVWVLARGKLLARDEMGQPLRAAGTHLDITDRKQAEQERNRLEDQLQQARKMEAIGRLAGGIAHDFNNLLTTILGHVELMREHLDPAGAAARSAAVIAQAAEGAAALTAQLLAFSRRQIIMPRALDLNELVTGLRPMLSRLLGETISLRERLSAEPCVVRADPGQFQQVLVNLSVNARDAMPDGGNLVIETAHVELDDAYCRLHPNARPGRYVMLAVSDTGQGMSAEVKSHLFEPFYTTKPVGRGTGLGLATIFGTVKQADGSIEVYSESGHGTSLKIYLPSVDGPAERLDSPEPAQGPRVGNETVLLVEDDRGVRELALRCLERLGYAVLCAADGQEAMGKATEHTGRIDLLITDVVMPGVNGRERDRRLAGLHPEMKMLFTSGYTADVIVHHGVVEQGLNFLGKPYTLRALADKIREVLRSPVEGGAGSA